MRAGAPAAAPLEGQDSWVSAPSSGLTPLQGTKGGAAPLKGCARRAQGKGTPCSPQMCRAPPCALGPSGIVGRAGSFSTEGTVTTGSLVASLARIVAFRSGRLVTATPLCAPGSRLSARPPPSGPAPEACARRDAELPAATLLALVSPHTRSLHVAGRAHRTQEWCP